ncbi:hypothetical protein RJ639_046116 [Escallonia herrerae]|uniref:Uncharacterized protein n=1 Tax=Escallonia herrerae TaxID=1293975 RepID=A0AA89AZ88_9ASTE|nr:hypothetical protein RJ639_046116 [Escallonia herrerae]
MANSTQDEDARTRSSDPHDDGDEESELDELEAQVKEMAQKIQRYRSTLPDQLKTTFASVLAAQRPEIVAHLDRGSDPAPSGHPSPVQPSDSTNRTLFAEEDHESAEKVQLLKDKISSNATAMPIILKRMKECMSKMDKLESCNGIIHPAFKRKRTT